MLTCNGINGLQNATDSMWRHWKDQAVFAKVPPCGRARFKTLWKQGHICPICPILFSCPVITHWTDFLQHASHNRWTRYPQTCYASHARLALHHVGAFDVRLSARMPDRVLGRYGTADSYLRVGLHVGSAMPCSYLGAWCDAYARPACRWIPAWIPANHRRLAACHV